MFKKIVSVLITCALCMSLSIPAFAAEYGTISFTEPELGVTFTFDKAYESTLTAKFSHGYDDEYASVSTETVKVLNVEPRSNITLQRDGEDFYDNIGFYFYDAEKDQWQIFMGYSGDLYTGSVDEILGGHIKEYGNILVSLPSYADYFYVGEIGTPIAGTAQDTPAKPATPVNNKATATPTNSKVLVNGAVTEFDAYTIDGNNYFKLRDVAKVVSGSAKQFEVSWDGAKKAINLVSNQAYTVVGGELETGNASAKNAIASTSSILKDGTQIDLSAYTIDGNTYFKLRDLGQSFDFGVPWDGEANSIVIDTAKPYTTN